MDEVLKMALTIIGTIIIFVLIMYSFNIYSCNNNNNPYKWFSFNTS
mgnify:CR=1 FL=1